MWRGVSLRQLAFLLLGPMIVETIWSMLIFWMGLQTTALGYEPRVQNIIILLPSLGYACSALLAGRWVTPRHVTTLMVLMLSAAAVLGLSVVHFRHFALFVVLGPVLGLCIGHYYVPFQIRMSHVQPFRTLAWTVAFYNIAWGTGAAVGPYLAGLLQYHSVWLTTGAVLALAGIHAMLLLSAGTAPRSTDEHHPAAAFASTAQQRRLGWVAFVACGLTMHATCFTLVPDFAKHRRWSADQTGLLVFLAVATLPLGALLWARLRHQMMRPWLMVGSLVIGAAGMTLMPLTTTWSGATACIVALGAALSCTVFHAIYYSNADPSPIHKARSIATMEVLAGGSSVAGPVLLGMLAWSDATGPTPWWVGGGLLIAAAGYVAFQWRREHGEGLSHR